MSAEPTQSFFALDYDEVLTAVETAMDLVAQNRRATGRVVALNSLENRVFDIELEDDTHLIAKFYRPGRWNLEQLQEEHTFVQELADAEVPAVPPLKGIDGKTLFQSASGIWFGVAPKVRSRILQELSKTHLEIMGRHLARLHSIGARTPFKTRTKLTLESHGWSSLETLKQWDSPAATRYLQTASRLLDTLAANKHLNPESYPSIRTQGDCHLGNTLWVETQGVAQVFFVDFDDILQAPAVQDVWMIVRGRDEEAKQARDILLRQYEVFREFPHDQMQLIEPLRALRMIHYNAWISRRLDDPAFVRAFGNGDWGFGTDRHWTDETQALLEILECVN